MKSIWLGVGALALFGLFLTGMFWMFRIFMNKMIEESTRMRRESLTGLGVR